MWSSLRVRLLLVVLACSLGPILGMGAYLLRASESVLAEKAREKLSYAALRQGAQVDDWLGDRVRELARWSASFVLFEGVPVLSGPRPAADLVRRDLTAFLGSLLEHNAVYESLLLTDPGGEVLVATRPETLEPQGRALVRELGAGTGRQAQRKIIEHLQQCLGGMHVVGGGLANLTKGSLDHIVPSRTGDNNLRLPVGGSAHRGGKSTLGQPTSNIAKMVQRVLRRGYIVDPW